MPMLTTNADTLSRSLDRAVKDGLNLKVAVHNTLHCLKKSSAEVARFHQANISRFSHVKQEKKGDKSPTPPVNRRVAAMIKTELCKPNLPSTWSEDLDDSLTNLQWLQEVSVGDILEGKPVTYMPLSPAPSSCSDDGKENDGKRPTKRARDLRHSFDSTVDYRTNPRVKPPYSYAALIIMAMKAHTTPKMTLSEIYRWIADNFVYFKFADQSWQNSIRHNLSLNKCFTKLPRKKGDPGKGGYWSIVPEYANKLLENSFRKRRASMVDYNCVDLYKRQRLDNFENRLLGKVKSESDFNPSFDLNNNSNDAVSSKSMSDKTFYPCLQPTLVFTKQPDDEVFADVALCQMDHPYGREPAVRKPSDSEADHIRAIAKNLQLSAASLDCTNSFNSDVLSNSQIFNTFTNYMRADCSWSASLNGSQNDFIGENMASVTDELLEARNIYSSTDASLISGRTLGITTDSPFLSAKALGISLASAASPFCMSPPLSGDEVSGVSDEDDLDDIKGPVRFTSAPDLTVRGIGVKLHEPLAQHFEDETDLSAHSPVIDIHTIKEEPLSPLSDAS